MATIETPPQAGAPTPPAEQRVRRALPVEPEEFHLLISELRDENSRSRLREALWLSIIVHLLVMFGIYTSPRWMPARAVALLSPQEEIRQNKNLTFLEASPDQQIVKQRPNTNRISDKDRIAASRNPQLRKQLQELADARRAGAPGPVAPPAPQPTPQAAPQGNGQPTQPAQRQAPPSSNDSAALQQPVQRNPFQMGGSAGSAIQEAARNSAQARGGGVGGDYGTVPTSPNTSVRSNIDILSDTQGVDFGPYLQRVLQSVRENWYTLIPEVARPPLLKRGTVAIEFVITKNGTVAGMRLAGPSGDVSLDRAAWGGITASNPFPPLPGEFRGEYLALRFHFLYNPERNQLR